GTFLEFSAPYRFRCSREITMAMLHPFVMNYNNGRYWNRGFKDRSDWISM
ncbi:2327_t:CDS:1, partial [Acaulospora morrowiae]